MDYDLILEGSQEAALSGWLENIHNDDVTRLAAKYRPDQPHCVVENRIEGSWNVCFKVVFTDGLQWIVRVPLPGRSMFTEQKVLSEVAVMKYMKSKTSIPVPDIIAFGSANDNVGGFGPFMITEFIIGDNLGVKLFDGNPDQAFEKSIYHQIAGFLLQLANCKFDEIGSIFMDNHNGESTWSVRGGPMTFALNEVLRRGGVNLCSKSCTSTTQYFLQIAEQKLLQLLQQANSVEDRVDAEKKLGRRRLFKSINPEFVHQKMDNGPFAIVYDLRPGNMLVRDGKIVAVIDWGWAYAGPIELLLSPPWWLVNDQPAFWDVDQRDVYCEKFKKFFCIPDEEEMKLIGPGTPSVSQLMVETWHQEGKFEYHRLLGNVFCFDVDWLWQRIHSKYGDPPQVSSDDARIVEKKCNDSQEYSAMCDPLKLLDFLGSWIGVSRCSFCWACLYPNWEDHDVDDCDQLPYDDSPASLTEGVVKCRSRFCYPESLNIHVTCGAPLFFGCTDNCCLYQMIIYPVYLAITGDASHLHQKARNAFSEHYGLDIDKISSEELMTVMARPHQVGSRFVPALVWFIKLIHDNAYDSFRWYRGWQRGTSRESARQQFEGLVR